MEGSFCSWSGDQHRTPMTSYTSSASSGENAFVQGGRDQFCMDSASAYPMNYVQELPMESETGLGGSYTDLPEDLQLLHIPSIHETMDNSLAAHDDSTQEDSTTDWDYFTNSSSCLGDTVCCNSELDDPATCEPFDDDDPNTSGNAPREPLKRLRRQRANDRERRRMKSLNGALNNLKRCIPLPKTKRRVTKLEILRIACHYIQTLWETLNNGNENKNDRILGRSTNRSNIVNGMTVSQRLNFLSNNLKLNFQL